MWKWSLAGMTLVMVLLLLTVTSPAAHAASGKKGPVSRPAAHAASGKKGPISRPAAHSIARGRSATQSTRSSTWTLASARGNRATRSRSGVYVVKAKDSLWALAARFYGSGQQWQRLYQTNRSIIGSDPRMIHPGQQLVLPR